MYYFKYLVNTKNISRIARIAERGERNDDKDYVSQRANLELTGFALRTYSSVVEHWTADPAVPGSTPGAS